MATGIKHVHKTVTRSRHLILFQRVLFGEGHEQLSVDVLNAERCIPWREAGIGKRASKLKVRVIDFDHTIVKVRSIDKAALGSLRYCKTFVYRAVRVGHSDHAVSHVDPGTPANNRSILGIEDEYRRSRSAVFRDHEIATGIENKTRRSRSVVRGRSGNRHD